MEPALTRFRTEFARCVAFSYQHPAGRVRQDLDGFKVGPAWSFPITVFSVSGGLRQPARKHASKREGSYSIFGEDTTIEVVTEFGTRTARVEESSPEAREEPTGRSVFLRSSPVRRTSRNLQSDRRHELESPSP